MSWLLRKPGLSSTGSWRVHLHCLSFWMIQLSYEHLRICYWNQYSLFIITNYTGNVEDCSYFWQFLKDVHLRMPDNGQKYNSFPCSFSSVTLFGLEILHEVTWKCVLSSSSVPLLEVSSNFSCDSNKVDISLLPARLSSIKKGC